MEDLDKTVIGIAIPTMNEQRLSLVSGEGATTELLEDIVVGRSADSGLHIDDTRISRRHAEIRVNGDICLLEDLGSANGTYVNGERLDGVHSLSVDDLVAFDNHQFKVVGQQANERHVEPEVDIDATVIGMAPVDAAITPKPAERQPKAPPEPEASPVAASAGTAVPGSWVDSESVDGTQLLQVEDLPDFDSIAKAAPTQKQSDLPHLFVNSGALSNQVFELPVGDGGEASVWELGREASCEVVLDDPSVSSKHAQLVYTKGRWRMVNMVSTNGIVINGEKKLSAYLADGDQIQLGAVVLTFKAGAGSKSKHQSSGNSGAVAGQAKSGSTTKVIVVVAVLGLLATGLYLTA